MEQNLVRRKCDFCNESMDFLQNRQPEQVSAAEAERIGGWVTLVRVHFIKSQAGGQVYPVQKHACKDSCAKNIIELGMLGLPKEILDTLAEEKRIAEEFQRKLADSKAKQAAQEAGVDQPLPAVAEA